MDIDFASLDDYVKSHEILEVDNFPPLMIGTESCRFVAMDAAGYGQKRLIDAVDRNNITHPTAASTLGQPHDFYQLYYDVERNGQSLGGVSIEMKRGEDKAWVSAWDAVKNEGIELGYMDIPESNVLGSLGDYIATHPKFIEVFGVMPATRVSAAITTAPPSPASPAPPAPRPRG